MALTFPLSVEDFADKLPVASAPEPFRIERFFNTSGLGTGQTLVTEIAPPRWRATFALAAMDPDRAAELQALADAIGVTGTFYMWNRGRKPGPIHDPDGAILGNTPVVIDAVGADNKSLRLTGFPDGYRLAPGDLLSFDHGSPRRRSLHRLVEPAIASGIGGTTGFFEVRPFLRAQDIAGEQVTLVKAAALMRFDPGTFTPGVDAPLVRTGMQLTVIEAI